MDVIGRLLVLVAVLLMPFGMAPAASASPVNHHAMLTGMPAEHCPGPANTHERNHGLATCSMACASALPAQEIARDELPLRNQQLATPMITQTLRGVLPEIATPPPRLA